MSYTVQVSRAHLVTVIESLAMLPQSQVIKSGPDAVDRTTVGEFRELLTHVISHVEDNTIHGLVL